MVLGTTFNFYGYIFLHALNFPGEKNALSDSVLWHCGDVSVKRHVKWGHLMMIRV